MSGLVAWVDHRRDLTAHAATVAAMTATAARRGPDGGDCWISAQAALGRRELVTTPGGTARGPAVAATGTTHVVLAHTGRPDDLAGLRAAVRGAGHDRSGGPLRTAGEVLLGAYLAWGPDFVDRVEGTFAVAVWDGRDRRLTLVRDRLGVRPLYYAPYDGGVLCASDPHGILANPLFEPRLDTERLPLLLQPRLALPGETPLLGLSEVGPGERVVVTDAGVRRDRWWRLRSRPHERTREQTVGDVRDVLDEVVGRQVDDAAGYAAMLSGGVDSTSVAALAVGTLRRADPGAALDSYCVEFASDPEHFAATELRPEVDAPYAAAAASGLGLRHHRVTAGLDDLLTTIPATRDARGLPGWGQFDASMHLLFARIARDRRVVLTGEAADELFAGYPYYFKPGLVERPTFPWLGDGPRLADLLSPEVRAVVDPRADEAARYDQLLADVPRLPGEDALSARMREVMYLGMAGPLAVILDRQERMSAHNGVEVRFPFCDHRLVELLWNVPWSMKGTGELKGLLKDAVADVVPGSSLRRRKSAYPHVHHPEYDRGLIAAARRIVGSRDSPLGPLFDTARVSSLLDEIEAGQLRSELPGGSSGPHLLIQLVEADAWITEHHVAVA
ncbi:asparagine synthase (glutamine-hydrolyzing) [Actinomycetospora sp. NBRC 106378]|uniref:asparagine synthase (glutamine-hydrolyzing) n=1 Tax=Actinomycetospora sp. NBRC 106378 TaxID=3032208 RepID=UPI0024A14116|nr:asparagine synthase (glutamine-hydrolyzing) [Actinomycetospora sp. NBRC 106378]GLZ51902.1 asparagine synthetase B [Actinomycetospora sp. NBRC 106378]